MPEFNIGGAMAQGAVGRSGKDGYQGSDGFDGYDGLDGLQGRQGAQGIQGIQGIQGPPGSGAISLLEQHTAAGSATLDFTTFINGTYDNYQIEIINILPATNSVNLLLEIGTGGGPTYDTTAANYSSQNVGVKNDGTAVIVVANPGLAIICEQISNVTNYGGAQVTLKLRTPQITTQRRNFTGVGQHVRTTGGLHVFLATIGLQYQTLGTPLTALRFLMSTGNIASGTIRIYGIA